MALDGIDVSRWQPADITQRVEADFYIIQVTRGATVQSPVWQQQAAGALTRGKALGLYHFDLGQDWRAECDNFLAKVQPYLGRAVLAWDWEGTAQSLGTGRLRTILTYLTNQLGFPPLLYGSASPLTTSGAVAVAADLNCDIWCANYPLAATEVDGFRQDLKPLISTAAIYQYTGSGRLPGYTGDLDLDVFYGDDTAWLCYATGGSRSDTIPYTVRAGDTLTAIAAGFETTWQALAAANNLANPNVIHAGQVLAIPVPPGTAYTVRPGDSLSRIATRFGTTWQKLAQLNGLTDPSHLVPGQKLRVR
jgi:lysozyme